MTTQGPAFCSLSPDALRERLAMIRREVLPHAIASEALPKGRAWRFANSAELRDTLERLVALERECCRAGVTFALEQRGDQLRLEVHGVEPDAEVFCSLEEGALA